jgi:predicted hydrolase (HD superfamily)
MEHAAQAFGMDIWEHVSNVILAMRKVAPELGLVGSLS